MSYDYDLLVIGAGSGGVRAARIAAGFGARVAIAEEYRVGGTCVIRGCVPKKLMVYASHFSEEFGTARGFGWSVGETRFDWRRFIAAKDNEINRLNGAYINTLKSAGVELLMGRATVAGAHAVRIGDHTISAATILIATGGTPTVPDIPGAEHAITSNEAFHLPDLPAHVVVVGGGYIAVEFAGIFHGMGAQVTQLYRGEQILRGFDDDIRTRLASEMSAKGIALRTGVNVAAIDKTTDGVRLRLTDGTSLEAGVVLFATGRRPHTTGLGLEGAGVTLDDAGAVVVDRYSCSTAPSIYAVGDCTNRAALTPVAIKEGHAFALTRYGNAPTAPEHDAIPTAVFSQPPIGTVGLSESQARREGYAIDVYVSDFRPMKQTLGGGAERVLMKLVVDRASDRVLGAHMIGADAAEIIQGIGIAVKAGLRKSDFDGTVAVHPSAAEEFVLMRTPHA